MSRAKKSVTFSPVVLYFDSEAIKEKNYRRPTPTIVNGRYKDFDL